MVVVVMIIVTDGGGFDDYSDRSKKFPGRCPWPSLKWNEITKQMKTDLSSLSFHELKNIITISLISKYNHDDIDRWWWL